MDDDFDIYGDLPLTCDIKDDGPSSKNNEECEELKKEVTELSSKLQKLQKINETLEVNLSSLLKTAKAEISRKDKMIDELRKKVDDMSFKRVYFNRNKREINGKWMQQGPTFNTQEFNNVQPEYTKNLTIETVSLVKTMSSVDEFSHDEAVSDYENFSSKHHKAKYTKNLTESSKLTTTVFTERLRKKIMEEDEAEQKRKLEEQEKQNLLLEINHENNREINIDDKENQSQFSIWNSNLKCKGTDHDYVDNINSPEDTASYMENQQRLVTKASVKRTDNDIDAPYGKRRKLETEQNTCISKDSLSTKEDLFNGYDDDIMSTTSIHKFDYQEDSNTCIERNDPHCNPQYARDHSRPRSNEGYYKRKEHYKKTNSDYNYSKESTYYHEKDKYNNTRNRSPVRYTDKKHKYHDDRYRDHRDKFDRRRNFHDKEEETPIIPNKRFYDLRHKDKIKFNRKYNSKDFYSPRHKESRYSDLRASRSSSHERSKSGSRERTNHKSYDRKSSKSVKTNNDLEKHVNVPLKKKNEINESKATSTLKKKDDISKKPIKTTINTESLESNEITDKSHCKSSTNVERKKLENATMERTNVDNDNKLENESVSSKPVDVQTVNDHAKATKEENDVNTKYEKNENGDQVHGIEDVIVEVTTTVNITSDSTHIPLDENKQDPAFGNTIAEKELKCDEHIHQTVDKEDVNACNAIPNLSRDVSNSVMDISAEAGQENNATDQNEIQKEELKASTKQTVVRSNSFQSNASKDKQSLPKNNLENETSNDKEEQPTVKANEQDNNENDHVASKDSESKKKSLEREKSKIIILARRRKHVQLADNNASMTIVITANNTNVDTDLKNNIENNLKSRACKVSRSYKNVL